MVKIPLHTRNSRNSRAVKVVPEPPAPRRPAQAWKRQLWPNLVKPQAPLAFACLLCLVAAPIRANEGKVVFTIWDNSGEVIHQVLQDGASGESAAGISPIREVPQAVFAPPIQYPKRLADLRMKGWVRLKFTIDEEGKVVDPEILEMRPRKYFARAALQAIRKYRFAPPLSEGVPMPLSDVTVRMTFDPEE